MTTRVLQAMLRAVRRSGLIAAMAAPVGIAPSLAAQLPPSPTIADRLLARADSITVGDYCRLANGVLEMGSMMTALAADSTAVRLTAVTICDPLLSDFTLRAVRGNARAPFAAVARYRNGGYSAIRGALFDAMDEFYALLRSDPMRDALRTSGESTATAGMVKAQMVRITETAHALLVLAARDSAIARLGRYERKLGPTSAKLNLPETLINYAAQRWVPGFAPRPTTGPSPLELVASYVPTYATYVDRRPQAVSASEFGIRWYLFGERFGADGWRGLIYPTYWSAGALTVSDRNGALVWPWDGRTRTGAYVSWGAIKVGYVNGRRGQWVVSRQTQIVPFVF